jgi:cell division protein FtsB
MGDFSLSAAASLLRVDRKTLNRRLLALGITPQRATWDARALMISAEDLRRLAMFNEADPMAQQLEFDELRREIAELRARIEVLEGRQLVRPIEIPAVASIAVSRSSHGSRGLPEGFASLSQFCQEHGISISTVKSAIQRGELTCHRGDWRDGRTQVGYALDEREQAAILERYG